MINETFQNCSIKYGHKKIFFLLVLGGAGREGWRLPASPAACPLLAAPALTCSLCALWSLWWLWVSGPLLPQKRLKKQMKQNYREWMETYLKGKPETQLEMLFLEAGTRAKLGLFSSTLRSGEDCSWRRGCALPAVVGWLGTSTGHLLPMVIHLLPPAAGHTHLTGTQGPVLVWVQPHRCHSSGAEDKEL